MRYKRRARRSIGIEIDPEVIEIWTNMNQIDFELIHWRCNYFSKKISFYRQRTGLLRSRKATLCYEGGCVSFLRVHPRPKQEEAFCGFS
jgi:hypothetical protein